MTNTQFKELTKRFDALEKRLRRMEWMAGTTAGAVAAMVFLVNAGLIRGV